MQRCKKPNFLSIDFFIFFTMAAVQTLGPFSYANFLLIPLSTTLNRGIFSIVFNTASSAAPQISAGIEPRTVATSALTVRRFKL
jgi:hypothetical protein